ncbi:hypothetical protein VTN49DRAFT_526 [Thermomyces lanuginosus]|uniref:uncharacterized protein n=1 Tax=Thermomyces lanuginosus TaxID=5541 RepID=UPI0037436A88
MSAPHAPLHFGPFCIRCESEVDSKVWSTSTPYSATITYDLIMPLDRFIAFALSIVSSTYMMLRGAVSSFEGVMRSICLQGRSSSTRFSWELPVPTFQVPAN